MRVEIFVEFKIRASVNKHAAITSFLSFFTPTICAS